MAGTKLPRETREQQEENEARLSSAKAATTAIERALTESEAGGPDADLYARAGARVISHYERQIGARFEIGADARRTERMNEIEWNLRLVGLGAERDELYRISRSGKLADDAVRALVREVDLQEARFNALHHPH